jgi:hypothetical protein
VCIPRCADFKVHREHPAWWVSTPSNAMRQRGD